MSNPEPTPQTTTDALDKSQVLYAIGYDFEEDFHFAYCSHSKDDIRDFVWCKMRVIPCTREQALAFVGENAVQRAEQNLAERT